MCVWGIGQGGRRSNGASWSQIHTGVSADVSDGQGQDYRIALILFVVAKRHHVAVVDLGKPKIW